MTSAILALLEEPESETLEFKSGRATPEMIARAACGMLNQHGGIVLWGVDDSGKVTGLDDAATKAAALNQLIMQRTTPRPLLSVTVHPVNGKELIAVDVATGTEKPYSLDRVIWVRVGSSTLRANPEQSTQLVEDSVAVLDRWEREPLPGFSHADCSREELQRARDEIARTGRFGIDVPAGDEELLERLYLARSGQLTNAAMVLFAREPRVWAPHLAIRVTSITGGDALANDVILDGPAIQILRQAVDVIQQRTGFSAEFDRTKLERTDRPAYALYALREGLVNAIVHRDYARSGGGVSVRIEPESLTISNPGNLPEGWSVTDVLRKHESLPRNPDIARVFLVRGLMDQLGLGAQRIVEDCRKLGARRPTWSVAPGTVSLTLYRAPEPAGGSKLSPRQTKFLKQIGPEVFKVGDYARSAQVSQRQARRELAELEKTGLVTREGAGPATVYRVRGEPEK